MIVGVDPGKSGGIAISTDGAIIVHNMPQTPEAILALVRSWKAPTGSVAFMEKVGGYVGGRGNTGSSMFVFGSYTMAINMALLTEGFEMRYAIPGKWMKALGMGTRGKRTKGAWKNFLKDRAEEIFPTVKVTLKNADALLILHAGRQGLI